MWWPIIFWNIMLLYISFLATSLNGEQSLSELKKFHIRIWIQIFTTIKSIWPCHTPNLFTKFHQNPSTTFWDIVRYISSAQSLNGEESLKKLLDPDSNSDLHQNWINSSSSHTQRVHQVSSEYIHNFLRYRALYRFWHCLSMVRNDWKIFNSRIQIGIFTKI